MDPTSALNEHHSETSEIHSCCSRCELMGFKGCLDTVRAACLSYLYMREVACPKQAFHRGPWHRWWCLRRWLCNHGDSCRRPVTPACSRILSDWHSWCCLGQSRPLSVFLQRVERFQVTRQRVLVGFIGHEHLQINRCIFMGPNNGYIYYLSIKGLTLNTPDEAMRLQSESWKTKRTTRQADTTASQLVCSTVITQ